MQIQVLKSKIHRVKVTGADLNYIGSITIDENLLEASILLKVKSFHCKHQQWRTL
jgi:aspartate 1-decarboxylase